MKKQSEILKLKIEANQDKLKRLDSKAKSLIASKQGTEEKIKMLIASYNDAIKSEEAEAKKNA